MRIRVLANAILNDESTLQIEAWPAISIPSTSIINHASRGTYHTVLPRGSYEAHIQKVRTKGCLSKGYVYSQVTRGT